MAKLAQTIDNLFEGVSRRPQEQRPPSYADEQINMLSIARQTVSRRPPLEHIAKVLSSTTGYETAFVEEVRRSESEEYVALIINGDLKVFNVGTGAEIPVVFPNAKAYLTGATDGFRAVTMGDHTVITNRSKITARGTRKSADAAKEALLYVRQGDYQTVYKVVLDGNIVTYTTPASGRDKIATDAIAEQLRLVIVAVAALNSNFTITRYGSTLHVVRKNAADFTVLAQDGLADKALLAIKGTVQLFSDLPTKAKPGFTVEIKGDGSTEFDNYFVKYEESNTPSEAGTWREVVQPDSVIAFDKSTMPHTLQYKGVFLADSVAQGDAPKAPTVENGAGVFSQNVVFDSTAIYPPESSVSVTLEDLTVPLSMTLVYTNSTSAYMTAAQMCEGLRLVVDGSVDWTGTVVTTTKFKVQEQAVPANVFTAVGGTSYDSARRFANSTMTMVANEHVGRTIKNLTDGSTATITTNTVVSIYCATPLAGGTDNTFAVGDLINIVGTGIYFTFGQIPWGDREAGTLTTVPFPSFIDKAITHVFEHQGRLGFLAGPNVVLSRAGTDNLFTLFRKTATQLLADDVIDFKSALSASPAFDSAVNWNGKLLLKSDKGQFIMAGEPVLAPSTVSLTQVSEYQSTSAIPLVVLGASAFFAATRSTAPFLWDLRIRGAEQTAVADDVTLHAPGYVRGTPLQLVVDDTTGMVFYRTSNSRNSVYVYATQYEGGQRTQAAWSRWDIAVGSEIVALTAVKGRLVAITKDAEGIYLNTAMLETEKNPVQRIGGVGHIYLDRLASTSVGVIETFSAGVTYFTLPYSLSSSVGTLRAVWPTGGGLFVLPAFRPGPNNQIAVIGDYTGKGVLIGVTYESRYRLSRIYRRDQNGQADTRGRLVLAWLNVRYVDTSDITVRLTDDRTLWILDGSVLLDGSVRILTTRETTSRNLNGEAGLEADDEVRMFLGARSDYATIDILTSEPGAMNVSSVSWEGELHDSRGSRF